MELFLARMPAIIVIAMSMFGLYSHIEYSGFVLVFGILML